MGDLVNFFSFCHCCGWFHEHEDRVEDLRQNAERRHHEVGALDEFSVSKHWFLVLNEEAELYSIDNARND